MLNSSSKSSSTALILAKFLPTLERLIELRHQNAEHEFGKQYSALTGDLLGAFTKMGMTEYAVAKGEAVDLGRMAIVEKEHSAEVAADTVVRCLATGLELQGNVIRPAECVASLGPVEDGTVPATDGEGGGDAAAAAAE